MSELFIFVILFFSDGDLKRIDSKIITMTKEQCLQTSKTFKHSSHGDGLIVSFCAPKDTIKKCKTDDLICIQELSAGR
jgi:hypothetical protein